MRKALAKLGILMAGILLPSVALAQYVPFTAQTLDDFGGIGGKLIQMSPAYGGPQAAEGGAGHEQTRCAQRTLPDGSVEVGCIYMSSNLENDEDSPWQCKMSVFSLTPTGGVDIIHDQVQVTSGNGNGDRPCGHPEITATVDAANWMICYGRDAENGIVQTYCQVRSPALERISNIFKVSQNNNNNIGAPKAIPMGIRDGLQGYFVYYFDNDDNRTYGRSISFDGTTTLAGINNQATVVAPADIGRPEAIRVSEDTAFACAAKGDNRPPEDGIYCRLQNLYTNTTLFEGLVWDANPGAEMYYNAPYVASLGGDYIAISAQMSNGKGKDTNNKGAAICQAKVFQRIGNDYIEMASMNDVTGLATHCSLSAANITFDGITARRLTVLGSPITGSGPAEVTFLDFDTGLGQLRYNRSRVAHAYPADAGKISNIYGENPNNQGRDYHTILADVMNPGYGVVGGYMPTVKSFIVITTNGRTAGEPKNAGFIRFLPAEVDGTGLDDDCVLNPATCENPPPPPDDDVEVDDDGDNPAPGNWGNPSGGNPGLLGCNVGHGRATGGFALLLLGFALFVTLRRR